MSAGICIMNKNAVALAADSAVTIGQHLAIHNSANKLFALSKFAPVGVIIYANSELMFVPAETIIKQYKKELGENTFESIENYVTDFLSFLAKRKNLFRFECNEQQYVKNVYVDLLNGLNGDYHNFLQHKIEEVNRELNQEELVIVRKSAIATTIRFIDSQEILPETTFDVDVKQKYSNDIRNYIVQEFPWIIGNDLENLINKICIFYNTSLFRSGYVGMAFAGFGEKEIFPKMIHLHISGVICGKVRYKQVEQAEINEMQSATISPFAQTDVMQTFLFGINDGFLNALGQEIPKQIEDIFQNIDSDCFAEGKKGQVIAKLAGATPNIIRQIVGKAQQQYLWPITQSVATLPIDELAMLAESMINITSLRRKVAIDDNIGTVGGPIDVAMITKSDGFIWMKRKHYFEPTYNPQYFFSHYLKQGVETND